MPYYGKLPSGKWRVIVKVNGRQRTATARTKAEVKALGARLELELGQMPKGGNVTVGEMLRLHLDEQGYAATTRYDLTLIVNQLPEDVLDWRVADVEPFTIDQLYRRLRKVGWTQYRVRKLHTLLSSAWTYRAGEYGWSSRTLMRGVRAPQVDTPEVHPPSDVDVGRVLAEVDRGVALFFRLAAVTGARRGELCGLQWADVVGSSLIVRRSVSYVPGVRTADDLPMFTVTEGKTGRAGQRVIGIDQATAALLETWRADMIERASTKGLPESVWVFSHRSGVAPWRGDYITREFGRACTRAGVDSHLHSLRHFMATKWLTGGEAAIAVAARLGHASTAQTLRTYAHFITATDQATAEKYAPA